MKPRRVVGRLCGVCGRVNFMQWHEIRFRNAHSLTYPSWTSRIHGYRDTRVVAERPASPFDKFPRAISLIFAKSDNHRSLTFHPPPSSQNALPATNRNAKAPSQLFTWYVPIQITTQTRQGPTRGLKGHTPASFCRTDNQDPWPSRDSLARVAKLCSKRRFRANF